MTAVQLMQDVRDRVQDDGLVSTAFVVNGINRRLMSLASKMAVACWYKETTATVAAGGSYATLPTDFHRTLLYVNVDGIALSHVEHPQAWNNLAARLSSSAASAPFCYRLYDGKIQVLPYPAASTALAIAYQRNPTLMTTEASTIDGPPAEIIRDWLFNGLCADAYAAIEEEGEKRNTQFYMALEAQELQTIVGDSLLQNPALPRSFHP
jgi:hypothetical protein